jgi:hypothetical protein
MKITIEIDERIHEVLLDRFPGKSKMHDGDRLEIKSPGTIKICVEEKQDAEETQD